MIHAGVIFYNDGPEMLQKSLMALKENGLNIIAVDGAFREFIEHERDLPAYSNDGCIDVAKAYANTYIPAPDGGWMYQQDKRNAYVLTIPDGEYFFVIDADEILHPFRLGPNSLAEDSYKLMENRHNERGPVQRLNCTRVFKKYPDLVYKYQHCRIYRGDQHQPRDLESGLVSRASLNNIRAPFLLDAEGERVWFDHRCDLRTLERKRQKQNYYRMREERKMVY